MSKMKIVVNQNQFERLQEIQEKDQVNQILVESLDESDYYELGVEYIRDWIKKNNIKLPQPKVPMSWVLKNYGNDIVSSLDITLERGFRSGFVSIVSIGKRALLKGFVEDPTISREGTFTEKYVPLLKKMSKFYLPDYVELANINESSPWDVTIAFTFDPDAVLKKGKVSELRKFKKGIVESNLFKVLGLKQGNSKAHGGVDLNVKFYPKYDWNEEVAPSLIKTIKKNLNTNKQIWQIKRNTGVFEYGNPPLKIYVHYNFRTKKGDDSFYDWERELNKLLLDLGYEFPDAVYSIETKY